MTVSALPPQYAMTAAIEDVAAALDAAREAATWPMSDDAVADAVVECNRLSARLAELNARLVREADRRGIGNAQGGMGTSGRLRGRLRMRPKDAAGWVRLANALDGPLSKTREALADGQISEDHARVIQQVLARLTVPDGTDLAAVKRDAEAFLLEQAAQLDPQQLAGWAATCSTCSTPNGVARDERQARGRRELHITDSATASSGYPEGWTPKAPGSCWPPWTRSPRPGPPRTAPATPARRDGGGRTR